MGRVIHLPRSVFESHGVAADLAARMTGELPRRDPVKMARVAMAFAPVTSQEELDAMDEPRQRWDVVLICAAGIFMLPIAMYWAAQLGGAVVRLAMGVM